MKNFCTWVSRLWHLLVHLRLPPSSLFPLLSFEAAQYYTQHNSSPSQQKERKRDQQEEAATPHRPERFSSSAWGSCGGLFSRRRTILLFFFFLRFSHRPSLFKVIGHFDLPRRTSQVNWEDQERNPLNSGGACRQDLIFLHVDILSSRTWRQGPNLKKKCARLACLHQCVRKVFFLSLVFFFFFFKKEWPAGYRLAFLSFLS